MNNIYGLFFLHIMSQALLIMALFGAQHLQEPIFLLLAGIIVWPIIGTGYDLVKEIQQTISPL